MTVHEHVLQGSEQWFKMRRGRPTASRFSEILTATGKLSKSSRKYALELIAETFCPEWVDFTGNKFTDRGQEMEPEAREAFTGHTGLAVEQVGFCTRDDGIVGCSPDGLIRDLLTDDYVAGLEIKCPSPKVHVGYIAEGGLPDDYKAQVHGGLAVTGLNEWHFFSYYPGLQPHHVVVRRDEFTDLLTTALDQFLIEYGAARETLIPRLRIA